MEYDPPKAFVFWTAGLAFAVWLINQCLTLWRKMQGPAAHPPNESLDQSHKALEARVKVTEAQIQEIWTTFRSENTKIRQEMNAAVDRIEDKFEKLPERIIALLKNTGAI